MKVSEEIHLVDRITMDRLIEERDSYREALERIANHSPESMDKVVLLHNITGYRECARTVLEKWKTTSSA